MCPTTPHSKLLASTSSRRSAADGSSAASAAAPHGQRQPGAAGYLRRPGETTFSPFVLTVLRIEHGRLTDIAAFEQPSMFTAFGLPPSL